MLFKTVRIDAVADAIPSKKLTSSEIEMELSELYQRLRLPMGRLEMMTGIESRYFWKEGTRPSEAAALAGQEALRQSSIDEKDVGCLIMCSVSRDCMEPATATIVHGILGLNEEMIAFDLSNACLGLITGMVVLGNMIEQGQVKAGLLVAGEDAGPLLRGTIKTLLTDKTLDRQSIKPHFASLTIGSGAVAVTLAHESLAPQGHRLVGEKTSIDSRYNHLCRGGRGANEFQGSSTDLLMSTDSEELMRRGVDLAGRTWELFKDETGWSDADIDCYCTHQVGSAHKKLLFQRLGADLSKDYSTLCSFGNTGAVSCPLTLSLCAKQRGLRKGEKVALLGIGSGINCTMMGVEW